MLCAIAEENVDELSPIEKTTSLFSFMHRKSQIANISIEAEELESIEQDTIQEENGIYKISKVLDTSEVEKNQKFSDLVDSVLK